MRKFLIAIAVFCMSILCTNNTVIAKDSSDYKCTAGITDVIYQNSKSLSQAESKVVYAKDLTYVFGTKENETDIVGSYLFDGAILVESQDGDYYTVSHDGQTAYVKVSDVTNTPHESITKVVSKENHLKSYMGYTTFRRTRISRSPLDKNPMPGHLSELPPVNEVTRRGSFSVHRSEKTPGSKYSSTSGLSPRGHLERQAEFHASTQDEA